MPLQGPSFRLCVVGAKSNFIHFMYSTLVPSFIFDGFHAQFKFYIFAFDAKSQFVYPMPAMQDSGFIFRFLMQEPMFTLCEFVGRISALYFTTVLRHSGVMVLVLDAFVFISSIHNHGCMFCAFDAGSQLHILRNSREIPVLYELPLAIVCQFIFDAFDAGFHFCIPMSSKQVPVFYRTPLMHHPSSICHVCDRLLRCWWICHVGIVVPLPLCLSCLPRSLSYPSLPCPTFVTDASVQISPNWTNVPVFCVFVSSTKTSVAVLSYAGGLQFL
jgi:hypothetical protein